MYHISQQACNALLVNMLKAGRWLFYLPVIYQPSTSMAQSALIGFDMLSIDSIFFPYAFLRCGSSDAPILTTSTARMMQSEATASISTHL